ncbi:MAG: glycosyltransferase [Acidobacteriota bacterium]
MNRPPGLIVTGMHRSGTSFVASLLESWNIRMGERLLPADRGNPAGYFEDLDFLDLNRRLLHACTPPEDGHRDWGWTESESFDAGQLPAYRQEAAELVAARERAAVPWGWKDPRTSMLLDFWDDVLGEEARFLLLYRHPWDVADSMLRTGADVWLMHPDYPARIWTQYNRRILDFHRRHRDRTLLVSTNRLLREPESFVTTLRRNFGVEASVDAFARLRAEGAFVSTPDDDPLPRLWRYTNPKAMDLLAELDDAADLGNDRLWETASREQAPQTDERPRLSVIVPCHNDGQYLIDAVASVKRHAPAAELIVVDDGSTQPRTREVLAALREAGVRVIEQPHSGLSAARNRGFAAAAGAYLLPLDADNRLLSGFPAEAVALLDAQPAVGVIYGDRREFGARTGDVAVPEFDLPRMLWSNYIDACAVVRRTVWSDAGGYDAALSAWEDWDFWLSAAEREWQFVHIPRATFEYRVRPDSMLQEFLRRSDYPVTLRRIYEKHGHLLSRYANEILDAAHGERRQLLHDVQSLGASRDTIQLEIDRLARGTQEHIAALEEIVAAGHEEIASVKAVLAARDEELGSVKFVLQAREEEVERLRPAQPHASPAAVASDQAVLTDATRVFTIVARNYLAYARVLAASLARHNPQTRLHVVILDDPEHSIAPEPTFEIIHAGNLPFDPPSDFYTMAATYDVTEMATAVKPWAFEYLFARGASVAIYLDPDIEVFDSLGPLEPMTREAGMLLTPHITEPLPRDGKRPDERDLLLAGMYNLGFLALATGTAKSFLPWWRERVRRDCLNDPAQGLFVDQRWIDFTPALFEPGILKDPGYNVAYWNLPHRFLERDGDRILVNGRPLRFLHFSGFSPRAPYLLSKHQHASPRVRLTDRPLLADLCQRYAEALDEAGFAECSSAPYGFATTAAGLPLDARTHRVLRRTYLQDEAGGNVSSFANPFSEVGAEDVVQRLNRPSPLAPGVSEWLAEIWSEREDLRSAFPRIQTADAGPFLDWVREQGVREYEIHPQLVPPPPPPALVGRSDEGLTPGVNVYGYAFAESGTGQIVRSVVAALAAEGIPYAVVPFTETINRQNHRFDDVGVANPSFDTNLICVNADQVPTFFESMGVQLVPGARTIGLWAWEVEKLPAAMAGSEQYLDEVWGISDFTARALSRSVSKPVRAFPLPVVVPPVERRTRGELRMPEGFLFLFCFDYESVFRRKNPMAVVEAFLHAFGNRTDVALYIKTTNADRHPAEEHELLTAAAGRTNIVIRDAYVTSDEYFSMVASADCYVSLHRSEGFGLTIAEAMALGKPVISTAWSSTIEFANESNSFPVRATLTEVGEGARPYPSRARWAEPDIAIASAQMARVFADRRGAAAVGVRARADIEIFHSPSARGPLLRRLLEESRRAKVAEIDVEEKPAPEPSSPQPSSLQISWPEPPPEKDVLNFEAQATAAQSLLASPRANLVSPMLRLVQPLRRLVLRCMRVYWVQQLAIDRAILGAMRTLRLESRHEAASNAALIKQQNAAQEMLVAETTRMREQLAELATDMGVLHQRVDAMTPTASQPNRAKARPDGDRVVPHEAGRAAEN